MHPFFSTFMNVVFTLVIYWHIDTKSMGGGGLRHKRQDNVLMILCRAIKDLGTEQGQGN